MSAFDPKQTFEEITSSMPQPSVSLAIAEKAMSLGRTSCRRTAHLGVRLVTQRSPDGGRTGGTTRE